MSNFDTNGARYYKKPTVEMLTQACEIDERIGGMIFVETSEKRGKFIVPRTIKVSQFLTETKKIDFSEADFALPVTTIYVKDFLGGIQLIVPPGVHVETHVAGLLSKTTHSKSVIVDNATDYENCPPIIVVKGTHVLSKVKVKVNMKVPPITIVQ